MTCHATKVVFVVFVIVDSPNWLDIHEFFKMFLSVVKYFTRVSIKLTQCMYLLDYFNQSSKTLLNSFPTIQEGPII